RATLAHQKENILAMQKDLKNLKAGQATISYDGKPYSVGRVREKLARDFASYQRSEGQLKAREQMLDAREKSLDTAREQPATMKDEKQQLELKVAQLEAQVKTVRLAQTRNRFHFDDTHLARCKATLAEIENRLKVEERTSELHAQFATDAIPVEKKDKTAAE